MSSLFSRMKDKPIEERQRILWLSLFFVVLVSLAVWLVPVFLRDDAIEGKGEGTGAGALMAPFKEVFSRPIFESKETGF